MCQNIKNRLQLVVKRAAKGLVACVCGLHCVGLASIEVYVAPLGNDSWEGSFEKPLATFEAARLKVRTLKTGTSEPIVVNFRGGEYFLEETVIFDPKDSGAEGSPVTYRAFPGEVPVFSGAKILKGWKPLKEYPQEVSDAARGKLWSVDLLDSWKFTSLYDGLEMLPRATSQEFYVSENHIQDRANAQPKDTRRVLSFGDEPVVFDRTITFNGDDLKDWKNVEDIEILMSPKHEWLINILPLESIDVSQKTAEFTVEPTYGFPGGKKQTYQVLNAIEHLDEPGEWAYNSREGRIYIWPDRDLEAADMRVPCLKEFIKVEGVEDGDRASHIHFEGLTFRHGMRDTMERGDKALQHDWEMYDKGNAILRLRHAEACVVRNCTFESSSGTGVRLDLYNKKHTIESNVFRHLGSTGILLSGYAPGLKDESQHNTIHDNYLHHIGTIYRHATAIFIAQSGYNTITHNTIHDLDYNGIVISGIRPHELALHDTLKNRREWVNSIRVDEVKPYLENIKKTLSEQWLNSDVSLFEDLLHARQNRIAYNDISRVMLGLHDGNAIYFSGMGEGNIAEYNYIHDVWENRGFIRLDDNSGFTHIRNNVFNGGRMMLIMKWNGEYSNNFAIDTRQITIKEWYPAPLDRIIFYSRLPRVSLMRSESWVKNSKPRTTKNLSSVSNSIIFIEKRADEFELGQDIIAATHRGGADTGMLFTDPLFDEAAMDQRIFRFLPGSPAETLGIEPIDLSSAGSTLARK